MPKVIAEYIDSLVNTEMRPSVGLPRGVTHRLYQAAREKQGGDPLVCLAATRLRDALFSLASRLKNFRRSLRAKG